MPDLCDCFENFVRTKPELTDLIGFGSDMQCYPEPAPEGATDQYLTYEENGGESINHLTASAGICHAVLGVYAYGNTRRDANRLAEELRKQLVPFNDASLGGLLVTEIQVANHRDTGSDLAQDKDYAPHYWTRRVYDIWHQEIV